MKKSILISLILLTLILSSGPALAWRGYSHGHFGFFAAPPPFWVGPPAVYYRGYYPPPAYYGPGYYPGYYYGPPRVWIPGHWESRWINSGWQRAWVPGYWRYYR
jgi:hypothetical protein